MVNNMKNFRKLSLIIIAWSITMVQGIGMCGQIIKDTTKIRKDYYLYHRINAHNIESSYYGNSRTIDSVLRRMENSFLIDSIAIFSTTSPEGTDRINNRISTLRAEETKRLLLSKCSEPSELSKQIKTFAFSGQWIELLDEIQKEYFGYKRHEVIEIIKDTDLTEDEKEQELKALDYGYTWNYLVANFMEKRRFSKVSVWNKPPIALSSHVTSSDYHTPPIG